MEPKCIDGNDLRQLAWRDLLFTYARVVRAIDEKLTAKGLLPMDWYDVLFTLYHAPDRQLRLSDLAERVIFSRSGVTRLVDRIEARGYLERRRCPEDRRGAYAALTKAGVDVLRQTWGAYAPLIDEYFGRHLSEAEAGAIHAGFARVLAQWEPAQESEPVQLRVRTPRGNGAEKA